MTEPPRWAMPNVCEPRTGTVLPTGHFSKDLGGEEHALAADPGNDRLAFHWDSSAVWACRGRMAPCAQTSNAQAAIDAGPPVDIHQPIRVLRLSEGHSNQVVQ